MAYLYDKDLEFLKNSTNNELDAIVQIITSNGKITEQLSKKENFRNHFPNHDKYIEDILEEIQSFGGNSVLNFIRKKGVLYKEILIDICKNKKIKINKDSRTRDIEKIFLLNMMQELIENMDLKERKELLDTAKINSVDLSLVEIMKDLENTLNEKNVHLEIYLLQFINSVVLKKLQIETTIKLGAQHLIKSVVPFIHLKTIVDITGPAYRVTIPTVLQISMLRRIKEFNEF